MVILVIISGDIQLGIPAETLREPQSRISDVLDSILHVVGRNRGVKQQQAPKRIADAPRLLAPECDARVRCSFRVQPQEIHILSNYDPSRRCCECKMLAIFGPGQTCIRCCCYVDATTPKSIRERRRNLLVQMKGERHRSGCFLQPILF
jgi:hypothetical protein